MVIGCAGDLLRRGVIERQRPTAQARQLRLARFAIAQQFRDPEVEQLHPPLLGHEDVGGLEIPVNDEVRVRVLHGPQYLLKQLQARTDRQPMLVAVRGQRPADDVLEGKVRLPARCKAGVQQQGDVRMAQTREDLALARKTLLQIAAKRRQQRQLQRHFPFERTVDAVGEPHLRHASRTERSNQLVRTETHSWQHARGPPLRIELPEFRQGSQRVDARGLRG